MTARPGGPPPGGAGPPPPPVDAVVLAAGRGERLGLGPKAWLVLGGRTLLERAVDTVRPIAARVVVGVAPGDLDRARRACGDGVVVVAGGATHRETMLAALAAGAAPLVLIHDVAHPFVTGTLAREVLAAAHRHGAAVAAVPSHSSAYHRAPGARSVRLAAGQVWLVRRPFGLPRAAFQRGLEAARPDDGLSVVLERAGVDTALVPSPSWNIKVTTPEDWTLAGAIERVVRPV